MQIALRLLYAALLVLIFSCAGLSQQKSPPEIIGSYLFRFEWGGTKLTLKADGTFVHQSSSCTAVTTESGPYHFSAGVLHFTTLNITSRGYSKDDKEIDLRKRKARKEILGTDEPLKTEEEKLMVIRWDQRIYLMDVREFESFVDAINLGFEPRHVDGYRPLYGQILLREGDENKDVIGLPSLPSNFLSMLLPEPITATVVRVEKTDKLTIATVDRGTQDGFRKGMTL